MPKIIIDSREQTALVIPNSVRRCLRYGDYSLDGYEHAVSIERKSHGDLLGSITAGRERLERELFHLAQMDYPALVIEATINDILRGHPQSRMNPRAALCTLLSWSVKYRLPVFFTSGPIQAAKVTEYLLNAYARYWGNDEE